MVRIWKDANVIDGHFYVFAFFAFWIFALLWIMNFQDGILIKLMRFAGMDWMFVL